MKSPILVFLLASICCHEVNCNTRTTTEKMTVNSTKLYGVTTANRNKDISQEKKLLPRSIDSVLIELENLKNSKKTDNSETTLTKRKSRILGSLAFLAGLGVGGLTSAASSAVKSYARIPHASLTLNLGTSRISPLLTAIYDPYTAHPYLYSGPLGLYPLFDPTRLQYAQTTGQNQVSSPLLNLLDNKRPNDILDNGDGNEEESKQSENDKTSNDLEEETVNRTESRLEADRNAEEKGATRTVICTTSNGLYKKPTTFGKETSRLSNDLQDDGETSLETINIEIRNKTKKGHHSRRTTTTSTTTPKNTVTGYFGMQANQTNYSPIFGYYDGNPQEISNIDFTTDTSAVQYDYGHINYNLPYDTPANFYPDNKYNYYTNPQYNSYPPPQYQQEQIPEYFSNDFNRYLYTPDNPQTYVNGFRPVL